MTCPDCKAAKLLLAEEQIKHYGTKRRLEASEKTVQELRDALDEMLSEKNERDNNT